jgi:hypothetical protein
MRIMQFQTNFSVGELDPLIRARTDIKQYQNALEEATNVIIQPQGGFKRREGLEFIYDFGSTFTDFKVIPFEFSVNDSFTLVFVNQRIYVFKAGVLQTNINGTGNPYIAATSITTSMLNSLNYTQAVDTVILCHEDLQTKRLVRNSDTSWTLENLPLTNLPQYAYSFSIASPGFSITPSDATGNILITAAGNSFVAGDVGNYIQVTSTFGRARLVEFISATKMRAVTEVDFFDDSTIASGDWQLEQGYEDTWSNTRGWPKSAAFHEARLYFGGSKSRPNTIWGSGVINYFDFDKGSGLADESVEATINTNQLNDIVNITSGNDFRIFTTGGEFVILQTSDNPITPSSFFLRPQTRLGSKIGLPVEDINGATVFIQRQGKSINAFQFGEKTASYQVEALSALSSHLLKDPIDMASRTAASTDESDRLFIVNGTDGSMAVYSIMPGQSVIAPSRFTTDGDFIAVAVEIADVFVIVKRTINGATRYMLEKFSSDVTLDSAITGGAASSVNMSQLQGKTVSIVRDGVVEPTQVVPSSPHTITFASAATSSYQVGLDYTVTARTMPSEPILQSGSVQGFKKRIVQVDAIINETQDMTINGKQISFRNFGEDVLDKAVEPFTGIKTAHGLLGYSGTGQITISQSVPLEMTVLGLEYRLSVGS